MPRDYRLYLEDMLEAIACVERYTSGVISLPSPPTRCALTQSCATWS